MTPVESSSGLRLGVGLAVLLSCSSSEPTSREAVFGELVTDQEVRELATRVVALNAARSEACSRPPLRAPATAVEPSADPFAAFFASAPVRECVTGWQQAWEHDDDKPTPAKRAVVERCTPILGAQVRAIAESASGCTAYGRGVSGPVEMLEGGRVVVTGAILAEGARVMAEGGDVQGALGMLLDVVRFGQDFARGRTDLIAAMIGIAAEEAALVQAHALLATYHPTNLDELTTATEALIASVPSFGDALAGDPRRMAIEYGVQDLPLPPVAGWARAHPQPTGEDARGGAIATIVVSLANHSKIAQVCPPSSTLLACYRGFAQVPAMPSDGTIRSLVQQVLVESSTASLFSTLPDYVGKRAASHVQLVALRMRLDVLAHGCAQPRLARLAADRLLGEPVGVTVTAGEVVVTPPAWVTSSFDHRPRTPLRIACSRP